MKKVLNGIQSFHALGLKKQLIAAAICAGLGMNANLAHAASPNVSPPSVKVGAPHVYVVKKGDTLWDISGKFLSKPWRWPEIWASNKHVKNPHWIYPGDRLLLCSLNGKPLVGKDEGDGCAGIIRRYTGNTSTLRPQVRVEALNNSIPVIPLTHIQQWLERTTILPADAITHTPYILGTADQRVLAGKGQRVYVRGNGIENGQRYGIFREGEPYTILDEHGKKQILGIELTQVASGVTISNEKDITTVELTDSYNGEVRRGDRVMPEHDAMLPTLFYPTDANQVKDGGKIIRVMGSIGTAAKNGVVTVDRGTADGIEIGQVFNAYQDGETVKDPKTKENVKLPGQYVGSVMVFKSFDRISYAYVLESELPIKVGSSIKPPRLDN
ncbi:LysM peptidoglycan-binding domain-containing protein [Acinetobacter suaedae]|uniref:LysM peptidoglycan-binding domain-containing protein n=1 Tax=Acinetobacter suaedae TaxID=2609668 RepID=A0A5P1UX85_9GAMM|nr:LysM peptidoglycan-binding domain-containing protein [Acinetobacter sp. C16S1]QER40898.1 LysM peptidoglycan-binding domain-containing protein [Acinetobacter sp. C16S1]